jgi:hypothetical protein
MVVKNKHFCQFTSPLQIQFLPFLDFCSNFFFSIIILEILFTF